MNRSPAEFGKRSGKVLRFVFGVAVITFVGWGQISIRSAKRDSDREFAKASLELAQIEMTIEKSRELERQVQDEKEAFSRELRSFKRPSMRLALFEKLKLPDENCIVSTSLNSKHIHQKLLIYSSEPGQQLVMPVWQQREKFDGIQPEPKHRIVIDVPEGEINTLEFGVVEDDRSAPYFIIRFAEEEKLRIDLPKFDSSSSGRSRQQASGFLLPNVISSQIVGYDERKPEAAVKLLRQGIWLRQHTTKASLSNSKKGITTNLAFCLYWKSRDPLYATGDGLASLPLDSNDPAQVQFEADSGLYLITPPETARPEAGEK
jgi:hypothetical protein